MPATQLSKVQVARLARLVAPFLTPPDEWPVNYAIRRYARRHPGVMKKLRENISQDQLFALFYEVAQYGFRRNLELGFAVAATVEGQSLMKIKRQKRTGA